MSVESRVLTCLDFEVKTNQDKVKTRDSTPSDIEKKNRTFFKIYNIKKKELYAFHYL